MFRSRLLSLTVAVSVCLGVADYLTKRLSAQTAVRFGDANFRIPLGWKHAETQLGGKNVLVVAPAGLARNEKFMITLLPAQNLGGVDFQQSFEAAIRASLSADDRLVQNGQTHVQKSTAGFEMLMHDMVVEDAAHHRSVRVICAANPNRRLEMLVAIADSQPTFRRFQNDFDQILDSFTFGANDPEPAGSRIAPVTPAHSTGAAPAGAGAGDAITRGLWVETGLAVRSPNGQRKDVFVQDISIDVASHTIYVAGGDMLEPANGGVFASRDGGQTWTHLLRGFCRQVLATASDRIYALQRDEQIVFSNDRGKTWTKCVRPRFQSTGFTDNAAIQCIGASPANPNVLYAGANGTGSGLYKSTDGGRTWTRPTVRATLKSGSGGRSEARATGVDEIDVDPQDAGIVIASFDAGFGQISDGGVTFHDLLYSGEGAGAPARAAGAVRVVHGGSVQINPATPNVIYVRGGGSGRTSLYRTKDGGRRWARLANPGNHPFVLTIVTHPTNTGVLYATTEGGIYVSRDGGTSWIPLQSADAPKATGNVAIPYYFNGTAFNSVATVVRRDEPMVVDPSTSHLLHGGAGVKVLVGVK